MNDLSPYLSDLFDPRNCPVSGWHFGKEYAAEACLFLQKRP